MLIRRQLETDYARRIDFNDHALDRSDHFIAGQWILPRLQLRMADASVDQVHFAYAALVLLKSRNFARIRRPHKHRTIAMDPSRIVRRVPKILHPVGRELRLTAGGHVAHPQVEIANERGALSVRRENVNRRATAPAAAESAAASFT